MTAYGNIDSGVAGLQTRTDNSVISKVTVEDINFGQAVVGFEGDDRAFKFRLDGAKLVFSADLVTSNSTIVTVNTIATAATVFATDHLTTMNAIIAKIKALPVSASNPYGVEAVLDSADANNRTILIRTKGKAISASGAVTLGGSQATVTPTTFAGGYLKGVAKFDQIEGGKYLANSVANIVERGGIKVPVSVAVNSNTGAFLASDGTFAASGTSISGAMYDSTTSGAGLADLILNGPVALSTNSDKF